MLYEVITESLAICLLHAYANPAHEEAVAALAEELGIPVSVSHRILPEYREFERTATTVVNAYVSPLMDRYLSHLHRVMGKDALRIMQSNGGSIAAETARRESVRTILSGRITSYNVCYTKLLRQTFPAAKDRR